MCHHRPTTKRYENCLICFFRPALVFGYTGITPVNFYCDHSERPVKCFLKRSLMGTTISAFLCVIVLFVAIHSAYSLYGNKVSTRDDVLLLGTVMINFIAMYLLTVALRFEDIKIKELEGIIQLITDGEQMGITFLDKEFVGSCLILIFALITMFVSLEVFTVLIFIIAGDFSFSAFKRLCTDTCVFMQGTVGTHYIALQLLLLHMFQKVLHKLKETLESRLSNNSTKKSSSTSHEIFATNVRRICRFYKSLYLNFLEENKFMGPAFLIWWNTILAVNIISVYVVLNSIMIQEPLGIVSIFFVLKFYGCMVGIMIYLTEMEVTAAVVSFWIIFSSVVFI